MVDFQLVVPLTLPCSQLRMALRNTMFIGHILYLFSYVPSLCFITAVTILRGRICISPVLISLSHLEDFIRGYIVSPLTLERDRGFEPPPSVWKTYMLAVKHQSRILNKRELPKYAPTTPSESNRPVELFSGIRLHTKCFRVELFLFGTLGR